MNQDTSNPQNTTEGYFILEGILDALESADEIEQLYLHGNTPGVSTGLAQLDGCYKPKPGQWTVITGIPGSGKSAFVDTLMVNLSELHGWKHLVCSPENQPVSRHIATLAGIHARRTFRPEYLSEAVYLQSLKFIQDHFRFIDPPEDSFTLEYILELAKAVKQDGFNYTGFVLDPWNELEHKRPANFSETEYISWGLSKLRRHVRSANEHLWLVAHPAKMRKLEIKTIDAQETAKAQYPVVSLYDISGSAHFFNKCDNGLSIWRDKYGHDSQTTIYVQKVRFKECGQIGEAVVRFDWQTGRLEDL